MRAAPDSHCTDMALLANPYIVAIAIGQDVT
jgi:hypothetical protein